MDQFFLDRPLNRASNMELFYDYRTNPPLYDQWHEYFRQHQPPTLIVWGKGDPFFGQAGATAYQRDLPHAELHLLNTGHSALEEDGEAIAGHIRRFLPAP
jgi:pimeloyl-ACP methyl ester carboxylesterase